MKESQNKRLIAFEKEDAYKSLELVNGWINNLDAKASFLLAYIAVVMGFAISCGCPEIFRAEVPDPITTGYIVKMALTIGLFLSLILSVVFLLGTLTARTKNNSGKYSMMFFGEIAKLSLNDYKAKVLNRTEDELIKDVLEQIHTNSIICTKKTGNYNKGIWCTLAGTFLYVICMVLNVF